MARLEQEQRDLLDLVQAFAHNEVKPKAHEAEQNSRFPAEIFQQMASMDLMGLPFAVEDGGSGQPQTVYLRVVEELSRAYMAVGLGLSVHTLSTWAVATYAPEPLRSELLPRMTSGEFLGAYSLSEPASGSDAAALSTKARLEGDHYVVDGVKAWVTHQGVADVYVLMCRTAEHKTRGVSALAVPGKTEGLTFPPRERKTGLRSSPTGQLVFEGARVPASNLLGTEGQGFHIAMAALDGGRLGIAAASVGLAQRCLDESLAYAVQRRQFGQPIGEFQGLAFLLADMATSVEAARALYLEAADRRDLGLDYGRLASMAKLTASDTAMKAAVDAVQVHGGYGYTEDFPVERLMREAKMLQIVEGTNQVQRMVISRDILRAAGMGQ